MNEKTSSEERFERIMAAVIASVAVLAALIAFWEADAATRSAFYDRQARQYTIQALGEKQVGELQVGDALYSARSWYELGMLAHSAEGSYDALAAQRYQKVQDRLVELSPFLSEYGALLARYEADTYWVRSTELAERAIAAAELEDVWDAKANAYIVHLTMLAVALALYGLSTVVSGRARWIFVLTGSLITVVMMSWAGLIYLRPVQTVSDVAIQRYAQGLGLAHQGDYREAIDAFGEALELAPAYANALFERGNARYALGDYPAAAADYGAARAAGRDDTRVGWNLGWVHYLQGRFGDAVETDRRTLELEPELLAVRFNLGLALLADGQAAAARSEYAAAVDLAAQQVARAGASGQDLPYSFWHDLDVAARDLQGLLDRLGGTPRPWTEAPPLESLAYTDDLLDTAHAMLVQLKSLSVALERTGRPPAGPPAASTTALYFSPPEGRGGGGYELAQARTPFEAGMLEDFDRQIFFPYGGQYNEDVFERDWALGDAYLLYSVTFPYDTAGIGIEFDYTGVQDGQEVLWKIYRNGMEELSLRHVETWGLGSQGWARKNISFGFGGAGLYQVELYVDNYLVQSGQFTVSSPLDEPAPAVLFEDDFSNPSSGLWDRTTTETFSTDYAEGGYRFYVESEDTSVQSTSEQRWGSVRIEADVTKLAGSDSDYVGLICNFQDTEAWNGYFFVVAANGRSGIGKWHEGQGVWLWGLYEATAVRRGNVTNHISAECGDGFLTLYVNGDWVGSTYDDEFLSGKMGMLASSREAVGTEVLFDNLVLTEPAY